MKATIWILLFTLLIVFSWHSLTSINQDIGRHLKLGEIIWQTKQVPTTNLFSYTEPDHPFINHHWLSEVWFYGLDQWIGLKGLIIFKVVALVVVLGLLLYALSPLVSNPTLLFSTFLGIMLIRERTDVRPEIFSYLFLAFFLCASYRFKYLGEKKWLYWLPLVQLLWVNSHIYFILGAAVLTFLLIDAFANHHPDRKLVFWIWLATLLINLANPNGLAGALSPLTIFQHYGYSVAENQSIFFLLNYAGGIMLNNIYIFFSTLVFLGVALWRLVRQGVRQNTFNFLLATSFTILAMTMIRNFALYGLALVPVLSLGFKKANSLVAKTVTRFNPKPLYVFSTVLLILLIYAVASNNFYHWLPSGQTFGLAVPAGAAPAVEFIQANQLHGPLFNNFDVGSYLIWKLFPEEKVFVDGRPEAYSVDFFEKVYKPMQTDSAQWEKLSQQYQINYVIFDHHDATPWAQAFLTAMSKNPDWPIVFVDDYSIIFLKRTAQNLLVIEKFALVTDGF